MPALTRCSLASRFTVAALALLAGAAQAQAVQGVSKTEILIATIQDLSGPVAAYGVSLAGGISLYTLAEYLTWAFLDELPRNTTGKILTRELKARFV